jgi:hypothetical protein
MSEKEWKPWWEKVADFDTPQEKREFIRGIAGGEPKKDNSLLNSAIAGFVGGMIAKGSSRNEESSSSGWDIFWTILISIGILAYWWWGLFIN